jgi:hypothetical protein
MAISDGTVLRVVASILFPDDVVMQNVFALVATTMLDTDEETVVEDMEEYIEDVYDEPDGYAPSAMTGDELKVYEYDSGDEDFDEVGTGITAYTGGASEISPHGLCLVQNFYTTDPDVQGRKFYGGFDPTHLVDGDWSSALLAAAITSAAAVVNTFVATVSGNTYQPVVWSPTNLTAYPYSATVVTNAVPGYQRRRKPGVGI